MMSAWLSNQRELWTSRSSELVGTRRRFETRWKLSELSATVRKLGVSIEVIPCEGNVYGMISHTNLKSYGLLLVY